MASLIPTFSALAAITSDQVYAAVFGRDDRAPLAQTEVALARAIGWLTSSGGKPYCTAFCVAPDMIATASHCLHGTRAAPRSDLADIRFQAVAASGSQRAAIAGAATANQHQNVVSGTTALEIAPPIDAQNDWAVAKLDRPVCKNAVLPLSTVPSVEPGPVSQVAFHTDRSDAPLLAQHRCPMLRPKLDRRLNRLAADFASPNRLLFHRCDTGGGSSGSPMLRATPTGPEVVAINVGTYVLSKPAVSDLNGASTREALSNTAVLAEPIVPAIEELSKRKLIDSASGIRRLTEQLRSRNLYHGPDTGIATEEVIAAIRAFERQQGLEETGLAQQSLLEMLERR